MAIVAEGFFSRLSFGLISFGLPLYAFRLGMSLAQIGFLTSLNMIVAIGLKPVTGRLADRFGLKRSVTVAIGLRTLVPLLLIFSPSAWQLFAIRSLHGVSIALRDPAVNVLIAEVGGKKAIASSFAWYQTGKSVAGSGGKALAGVVLGLTASSFPALFAVALVLSALPLVVVMRFVRDLAPEAAHIYPVTHEREAAEAGGATPTQEPVAARNGSSPRVEERPPSTVPYVALGFSISATAYMMSNLFPILATEYAGLSETETGTIYLIGTVFALTGPFWGWLSDHVSQRLVLSTRGIANVLSSVTYLVAPTFSGLAAGKALDDTGKAAFRPAWGALMARAASYDKRRRARVMGRMSAGEDAGEMAGPIAAGVLWSAWGIPAVLGVRICLALITEVYAGVCMREKRHARPSALTRNALPDLRPGPGRLVFLEAGVHGVVPQFTAEIRPGQTVAVAPSPPVKEALVHLATGARVPDHGAVLLDGQDLAHHSAASVRRAVSLLLRESFDGQTVRESLTRRWEEAPWEELVRVWRLSGLSETVGSLSSAVHQRTKDLDSTQRMQLSLAACLVGDPAVLVLEGSKTEPVDGPLVRSLQLFIREHRGSTLMIDPDPCLLPLADAVLRLGDGGPGRDGPSATFPGQIAEVKA